MAFTWLKPFLPRGLYGRAALILILPVVLLQLFVSVSFVQRHYEGVTEQMTRSILYDLRLAVREVAAAPSQTEAQIRAAELGYALQLAVSLPVTDRPGEDVRRPWDLSGRIVARMLREALPGLEAVSFGDKRRVRAWVRTEWGDMRLTFRRTRVSASNPHQLLIWTIFFGAVFALIAFAFLRNQLRPIKRLAAAAAAYGKGRVLPYRPGGAVEVRQAGQAFLDMRERIEVQKDARVLMLSGISHDLRTPLTRLTLGLELLPEEEAEPLRRDVRDMERMVAAFLDFARGDSADEEEEADPAELLRRAAADAERGGGDVNLRSVAETGPARLRAMAVRRALDNLIGNALRYGSRVEVALEAGEGWLAFVVEDDGPGIPESQRAAAMRPFARLDPARGQGGGGAGVGLGLAIVDDIAQSHGGRLVLGESMRLGGLRAEMRIAR
ncbi:ATP-binding protein [Pseudoroseicyclus tamaricis]|uniref:histidine kinase n=1 Tax=Pseudoroseicyclus tamaricis TaxID=2705421 RepID=A0A6B2JWJ9_9RHOB|nr:ATP-binding protein [Pseudoroseicyclus tamaricis]NDV00594.1 HAMP domain-containing protein [Pseudoroseicyclus tamaricis]